MKHEVEEVLHEISEVFNEDELLSHSHHSRLERLVLISRNICVILSLLFFIASLVHFYGYSLLKAIGYFIGAVAYVCEILLLTDCFAKKVQHSEMFMAYCFGPMYILMGLGYLLN